MRPSFYTCGAGSDINCKYWDDINGCWKYQTDCLKCPIYQQIQDNEEED